MITWAEALSLKAGGASRRPPPACTDRQAGSYRHVVTADLILLERAAGSGETCRRILSRLPGWFGIKEANEHYVAMAEQHPSIVAVLEEEEVGLLTMLRHSPESAEVYLIAVVPFLHRQGVGSRMLARAEETLASDGVRFLQVKTLSPAKPDEGYEKTRAFYRARGFSVLEEFPLLWGEENPALQLIKVL